MKEIWKDIKNYEGLYQISNTGKVKRLSKIILGKNGTKQLIKEKIMNGSITFNGYVRVGLSKNGKVTKIRIHRLVAETFIPNPNNLKQINHIDGDKTNNNINNLEWVTPSENIKHAYRNKLIIAPKGKKSSLYGKRNGLCKNSKKVICITTDTIFDSIIEIERKYGISHQSISECCKGRRKYAGTNPITGEKLVWKYLKDS